MAYFISGFKQFSIYKNEECCCVHFYRCYQQYNRTAHQSGNSKKVQQRESIRSVSTGGRQLSFDSGCLTAQYLMYPPRFAILVVLIAMTTCSSMATPVQVVAAWSTTKNFSTYRNRNTPRTTSQIISDIEASSRLPPHLKSNRFASPSSSLWSSHIDKDTIRNFSVNSRPTTKDNSSQDLDERKIHLINDEETILSEKTDRGNIRKRRSLAQSIPNSDVDALERLSRVFGIHQLPSADKVSPHLVAPEYMTQLYQSITDSGGLTKAKSPYNADIIRSFPDRDYRHQMHFYYNITFLERKENILQAEFHIFKLRPKTVQPRLPKSHLVTIQIYQVLSLKNIDAPSSLRLVDVRRVSAYQHGWITFTVVSALLSWMNNTSHNYGLLVRATLMSGEILNGTFIRFAQRKAHHDSKQPILVVFTDDGQQKHRNYISPTDEGYQEIKEDILRHELAQTSRRQDFRKAIRLLNEKDRADYEKSQGVSPNFKSRQKRSVKRKSNGNDTKHRRRPERNIYRRKKRNCARYEMYVDFSAIGWSGWIISPKGYNAYHCAGACPFPLGQSHKPTNHATVQSIVHALHADKNVLTPCCVPDKLYSISLLYFDDEENVILKLYEDMVAASCGCH
ncbi:bone morphogenetic protein 7 [Argonauta hians]